MLQDLFKQETIQEMQTELTSPIFEALESIEQYHQPEYFGSKKNLAKYLDCNVTFIDRVLTPRGLPSIPITAKKIMYKKSDVDEFLLQFRVNGADYVPGRDRK